jgi:hypothetical protein
MPIWEYKVVNLFAVVQPENTRPMSAQEHLARSRGEGVTPDLDSIQFNLNRLGADGWELVAITPFQLPAEVHPVWTFRREVK